MNDADLCRANGWKAGYCLLSDVGYGPTTIELTVIGESQISSCDCLAQQRRPRRTGDA